jgi:hypothetical protein
MAGDRGGGAYLFYSVFVSRSPLISSRISSISLSLALVFKSAATQAVVTLEQIEECAFVL